MRSSAPPRGKPVLCPTVWSEPIARPAGPGLGAPCLAPLPPPPSWPRGTSSWDPTWLVPSARPRSAISSTKPPWVLSCMQRTAPQAPAPVYLSFPPKLMPTPPACFSWVLLPVPPHPPGRKALQNLWALCCSWTQSVLPDTQSPALPRAFVGDDTSTAPASPTEASATGLQQRFREEKAPGVESGGPGRGARAVGWGRPRVGLGPPCRAGQPPAGPPGGPGSGGQAGAAARPAHVRQPWAGPTEPPCSGAGQAGM